MHDPVLCLALGVETGAMTDASKRLTPDGGFTASDLPDDVAYELFELPKDLADGFSLVEERILRDPWFQQPILPAPTVPNWEHVNYEEIRLMRGFHFPKAWTRLGLGEQRSQALSLYHLFHRFLLCGQWADTQVVLCNKRMHLHSLQHRPHSRGPLSSLAMSSLREHGWTKDRHDTCKHPQSTMQFLPEDGPKKFTSTQT